MSLLSYVMMVLSFMLHEFDEYDIIGLYWSLRL